ncbi:hypothetical protein OCU04_005965 [Sclerotinia nivalis]|uniref:Uncharacterized protein n=1 Tax=Sclerotinia nivalis TaxID=352851 RepID=A0A9X0DIY0_9HELO|nr:hypothetical protein OCU04_005965 [Sclerotinia nivalis]
MQGTGKVLRPIHRELPCPQIVAGSPHYNIEGVSSFTQSVTRIHAGRKMRCFLISIGRMSSSDEQGMMKSSIQADFQMRQFGEDLSSREFSRMGIWIMGIP